MNNKMDLDVWAGGLQLQEIEALDAMQEAFVAKPVDPKTLTKNTDGSFSAQLGLAYNRPVDPMFPWKGYAGFRFVDCKGFEGEFDLVLVTHERVLIIELKELKGKKVTSDNDKWYCDGYEKYRSPVAVTQRKIYLLKDKLDKVKHKFSNCKTPWIDFLVVLSNNNDYSSLPDQQKKHVMGINEFVKLADEGEYNSRFNPRKNNYDLNSQFEVFDELISGNNVKPKHISVQNYITTVDEQIFPLPGQEAVYTEYIATSEANKNDKALLRQWDFNKIGDSGSKTSEGRYKIIAHERDVLIEIKNQAPDLYRYCLQPKTNPTSEQVTRQFHELYDLPTDHRRFNEYINQYVEGYTENERVTLVQVLLNQFSDLHQVHIAHRDIGDHSLWLSPSKKVSLSSFISSYYQPLGTVGERREMLSVGVIPLPEDSDPDKLGTPYHRDVYALGIISQLIFSGRRVTIGNIEIALNDISDSESWYKDILRKAVNLKPSNRFKDAAEFRDALASVKPPSATYVLHDEEQLEAYRKRLNPYKVYPIEKELKESNDKEVYISGNFVIRLWSDANPSINKPHIFQACLDFIKKANQLYSVNSTYLAHIKDFGIAHKTSQLFLVQEYIIGCPLSDWMEDLHEIDDKKFVIQKIIQGIEYLHHLEFFHGDLHPGNIIISGEEGDYSVCFIDYLDFSRSGKSIRNHRYSPVHIDTASDLECDNYAVMRISAEILGIDWGNLDHSDDAYNSLVSVFKSELNGAGSFLSLERFKQAFDEEFSEADDPETISICIRSDKERPDISILPDNEELFLHVETAKNPGELQLHFSGIGGSVSFFYVPQSGEVKGNKSPRESETVGYWERSNSQLVVNTRLQLRFDQYRDYSKLIDYLRSLEGFEAIAKSVIKVPTLFLKSDAVVYEGRSSEQLAKEARKRAKPHEIWRAMIDTEVDALPTVTLTEKPDYDHDLGLVKLQYSSSSDFMERFSVGDEVELFRRCNDKEFDCGKLNIKESNSKYLYITSASAKTQFNIDDVFYLRTSAERSSFIRRKKAVNRILDKTSVIPNLVDYFGYCSADKVIKFSLPPTDEAFEIYDRDDGHEGTISLNEQQRIAFSKLLCSGPVSLLQGPPGTGKTEFIAAFTHYLINQAGANHILLVSQSHEAVNTAAERIRQHCLIHNTDLDVVRFSNKSNNISSGLVDVYSIYLVEERLEEFRAQFSERIFSLQKALGLPRDYIQAVIDKELSLSKRLRALKQINVDISGMNDLNPDRKGLIDISSSITQQLISLCQNEYGVTITSSSSTEEIARLVDNSLNTSFGIAPNEAKRMGLLISLMCDYQERLDTSPGSFE